MAEPVSEQAVLRNGALPHILVACSYPSNHDNASRKIDPPYFPVNFQSFDAVFVQ